MPILAAFPSAARVVGAVLADLGTVVGETGLKLQTDLATGQVIRVRRIGGGDDRVTDRSRVDVDVYAVNLSDAEETAEAARQLLISGPTVTTAGVLDRVDTDVGPREVPSPDPAAYRVVSATYRVSIRRR